MNRSPVAVTVRLVASSSTIDPLIQFKSELAETIQERANGRLTFIHYDVRHSTAQASCIIQGSIERTKKRRGGGAQVTHRLWGHRASECTASSDCTEYDGVVPGASHTSWLVHQRCDQKRNIMSERSEPERRAEIGWLSLRQ